jgi:uncharacterized damage-inducible protein DinB
MTIAQNLLAEWQHEAASTRKMLAALPEDKLEWTPHEKSMKLGYLAYHLGYAVELFAEAIGNHTHYEWSGKRQSDPATKEEILQMFERADAEIRKQLEKANSEWLATMWHFGPKEKPFMSMPREAAIRAFIFSHMIHHRGQLSVYLRLTGVSVPGMYGPSADEKM